MLELIADNAVLRVLLMILLFAMVAAAAYFAAHAVTTRQLTRQRLLDHGVRGGASGQSFGSLRTDQVESSWLKLVNSIEKSGLSLVDTKDESLRKRLAAAGFTASYAPRVYTLLRLVL